MTPDGFVFKVRKYFRIGSILFLIISIVITFILIFLSRFSFMCFDTNLCQKLSELSVVIPDKPW
jgi:hypothetical protein